MSVLAASCLLSSCDYLDVVPPEQPNLPDATSTYERTLGFLYSCYTGIATVDPTWANYLHEFNASTDEYTLPYRWTEGMWDDYAYNNVTANNQDWLWGSTYQYIGQCLLFLQEVEKMDQSLVSEDEMKIWRAEANFLIAYYHFITLRSYGPIPITDSLIELEASSTTYNGRFHFDYCVDWIAKRLDEAAADLPAYREKSDEWGRATKVIAKAVKARLLLYAASPLWNGGFPYPTWKNVNFETPGYGKDLVSTTYDATKWDRALAACKEALELAEGAGKRELYQDDSYYATQQLSLPYIPGLSDLQYDEEKQPVEIAERNDFLKAVMRMRYLVTTNETEGNREIIWGNWNHDVVSGIYSLTPHRVMYLNNSTWWSGYSGVSPTLNTVQNFYDSKGYPITSSLSDFVAESEWYKPSAFTRNITNDAGQSVTVQVANLHIDREPRFYAWIGFDGGDYTSKISAGQPLVLEMRNPEMHGFNADLFNRDNSATGYLSQKFIRPNLEFSRSYSWNLAKNYPAIQIRLAELYLNLAECYAAKGDVPNTLKYLNPIRKRAGINELSEEDDITRDMSITDWVRRERSIELWAEGHRFFDVRRWKEGDKYFGADVRKGLNAGVKNPTWEEFYTPTVPQHPFNWHNRMYLNPVFYNEVYKNPQMVQAPEY